MISFCQDLSISYKYHVYENKTIKKITHSRNGSNLSEKISGKSNKLFLVSKNPPHNKSTHSGRGISLTDIQRTDIISPKNKTHHKRHFSNHVEMKVMHTSELNYPELTITPKDINFTPNHEMKPIEFYQRPFHQRIHFNRPQYIHNIKPEEKTSMITQSPTIPSYSFIQSAKPLTQQHISFSKCELYESQTIRINGSIQRLNESMETKKFNYDEKPSLIQNHSQANSLTSYPTLTKFGLGNAKESETEDDKKSQRKWLQINKNMMFLTPKITHARKNLQISNFNNSEHYKDQHLECKIILPQTHFQAKNFYDDLKSPLFDAVSIVSKNFNEEELDDQTQSIVEQRNFFFEKEEEPNSAFKKSIEKYIFFEAGHVSNNRKWKLFRNVQERENRKMYSVKEFSSENERDYFNEYDVYLSLKAQTSQQYSGMDKSNLLQCVFLQLFNALSNNEEKKLHLVKQPFEYLLQDYICHLRKKNTLAIDRIRVLVGQKSKLQTDIEKIFEFFCSKDILIREDENLELEDFVICNDSNGYQVVKFHGLSKLQKGEKMHKFLRKQSFIKWSKRNKEKLEQLHQKIHAVFFFT